MVTRAEVIRRAATLWPAFSVPYNQGLIHSGTGYRQDCSGFVSMCWGIPPSASPGGWGGLSTITLVTGGYMSEIRPADLRPGDAVGICGPGTAGNSGHIALFERWYNDDPDDDRYWAYEQAGGRPGPIHRVITYPYNGMSGPWRSWRFRDISDEGDSMAADYGRYGKPAAIGDRTPDVLGADEWGHEMLGHSPWGGPDDKSYRGRQLQRIEDKLDRVSTGGVDAQDLAVAVVDELARRIGGGGA